MQATATRQSATLQPQLSASLRFAVAVAVAAGLALAWVVAEQASHQAVQSAAAAFSGGAAHGSPPTIDLARRQEAAARQS